MVADCSVGPALILVFGICCDLRIGSVFVNSIRDIHGFLGGSVRTDNCLSIYICIRICTGCSFSVASHVSGASNLGIHRLCVRCESSYRSNFRDGYRFDSVAVFLS